MNSDWQKLYRAAFLETDWSKIEDSIKAADSAISARLREFSLNHGGTQKKTKRLGMR